MWYEKGLMVSDVKIFKILVTSRHVREPFRGLCNGRTLYAILDHLGKIRAKRKLNGFSPWKEWTF